MFACTTKGLLNCLWNIHVLPYQGSCWRATFPFHKTYFPGMRKARSRMKVSTSCILMPATAAYENRLSRMKTPPDGANNFRLIQYSGSALFFLIPVRGMTEMKQKQHRKANSVPSVTIPGLWNDWPRFSLPPCNETMSFLPPQALHIFLYQIHLLLRSSGPVALV